MNIAIADALRQRCGRFGSPADLLVPKVIEQVRREKADGDLDNRNRLLGESLQLLEETAASLTMENLRDTVTYYWSWNYYPGSVPLALTLARESGKGNEALGFLADGAVLTISLPPV